MNQMTLILQESNRRMDAILKGKYEPQRISAAQAEALIQLKAVNSIIQAYSVASKNKRALAGLDNMNIMDGSTAVDLVLGNPEEDKVKCPEKEELITRAECLDYSGSHLEDCGRCEIGRATKKKLLPESL